jgi:predicted nucleic acid-binding protein
MKCPKCGTELFLNLSTGDEPPTEKQLQLIEKIAKEKGAVINPPHTKAEASWVIDRLVGKVKEAK